MNFFAENQKRVHFTLNGDDEDGQLSVIIIPEKEEEDEEGKNVVEIISNQMTLQLFEMLDNAMPL